MAEKKKVTEMLLKVHCDLKCSKCYKKVKKILCEFPQIQDQVYDEKNNTVKIKVVCCSPEKIRDKIRCKGRGIIISIEIMPPKKSEPIKEPKPEKPKTPEVNIELENNIVINFKPCYCGRNCDGRCGRPVNCSCGCGGNRGNCGRPVCSCGCGGFGGNCVRLVYCSCGCGGYRGNCGSRCHEYYYIEDNSQGCSIS